MEYKNKLILTIIISLCIIILLISIGYTYYYAKLSLKNNFTRNKMKECNCNKTKIRLNINKEIYLNTNSTYRPVNKEFNYSDILYPEIMEERKSIENITDKIKTIVGADKNDTVIFTSSCSESLATVFNWLNKVIPYGNVVGSSYDHSVVKNNAELYNFKYIQDNSFENISNASAVVLTQVSPETGEILNINDISNRIAQQENIYDKSIDFDDFNNESKIMQYRPWIIVDATQSFLKLPINMKENNIDIVVASLHKIGFPINFSGILVISNRIMDTFVPLIGGIQQNHYRGGSINPQTFIDNSYLLNSYDTYFQKRKTRWEQSVKYLREKGLTVYEPKTEHLYNTILIDTNNNCPLKVINSLANKHNIYISPKTACLNEKLNREQHLEQEQETSKQNSFKNAVRISFMDPKVINKKVLSKIIQEIQSKENFTNETIMEEEL